MAGNGINPFVTLPPIPNPRLIEKTGNLINKHKKEIGQFLGESLLHIGAGLLSPGSEVFMIPEIPHEFPTPEEILEKKKFVKERNLYLEKIESESVKVNEGLVYDPVKKKLRLPTRKEVYPGAGKEGVDFRSLVGGKQFLKGGYTGSTGGIVHPHEMVMNPIATQKYFPVLEKMNYEGRAPIPGGSSPQSPAASNA